MSQTDATFLKSQCQSFVRSGCQARRRTPGTNSTFKIAAAVVPLWGFGAFDSTSNLCSVSSGASWGFYYGRQITGQGLVFQNTWPKIYNKLVETWTQGSSTAVRTTEMSPYYDVIMTTTFTRTSNRTFAWSPTVTGKTVTDTLVTVNYDDGAETGCTYTAQLSGTILQPSATGPFDPNDSTYGWDNLVTQALSILSGMSIPASDNTFDVQSLGSSGTVSIGYQCPILAAANGVPVCLGAFNHSGVFMYLSGGDNWLQVYYPIYGSIPSITEFPNGALPSPQCEISVGGCLVLKSEWALNGADLSYITYPTRRSSDHTVIYAEGLVIDSSTGVMSMDIPIQTTSGTVPYSNPVATPATYSFSPSDCSASGTTYGMLGFLGTDA